MVNLDELTKRFQELLGQIEKINAVAEPLGYIVTLKEKKESSLPEETEQSLERKEEPRVRSIEVPDLKTSDKFWEYVSQGSLTNAVIQIFKDNQDRKIMTIELHAFFRDRGVNFNENSTKTLPSRLCRRNILKKEGKRYWYPSDTNLEGKDKQEGMFDIERTQK